MKDKKPIINDFMAMLNMSWTWDKLTEQEKKVFIEYIYEEHTHKALKGTRNTVWQILNEVYHTYLLGLGYKPIGWREKESELNF